MDTLALVVNSNESRTGFIWFPYRESMYYHMEGDGCSNFSEFFIHCMLLMALDWNTLECMNENSE